MSPRMLKEATTLILSAALTSAGATRKVAMMAAACKNKRLFISILLFRLIRHPDACGGQLPDNAAPRTNEKGGRTSWKVAVAGKQKTKVAGAKGDSTATTRS